MGKFTPKFGEEYTIADHQDKYEVHRARQLYDLKNLGTKEELALRTKKGK